MPEESYELNLRRDALYLAVDMAAKCEFSFDDENEVIKVANKLYDFIKEGKVPDGAQ